MQLVEQQLKICFYFWKKETCCGLNGVKDKNTKIRKRRKYGSNKSVAMI